MSVYAPSLYSEAFSGEPLPGPVERPILDTARVIWSVLGYTIQVPLTVPVRAPAERQMITDIRAWTGWSQRRLAEILDTSHTTVRRAEAGRTLMEARSGDLRRRLESTHAVIQRVFLLAGQDPEQTGRLLETVPADGSSTAVDALRCHNPERAYLAAVDLLRPRPTGMLLGNRPRQGGATTPLHD